MKKTFLTILVILGSLSLNAQFSSSNNLYSAGDYLVKAKNQLYAGLGFEVAGAGMIIYGISLSKAQAKIDYLKVKVDITVEYNPLVYVGAASCLTGIVFQVIGLNNIGRAGIIMDANNVGLAIPLEKRK